MVMSKKSVMGIGTLIIFIAMILVAAVAAGVIIRTAGVLQQRAYAVGAETRQRILSLIDISNVIADVNLTSQTSNEVEILVRLGAGSYPIPFATTGFTFYTQDMFVSAKLQDPSIDAYINNPLYNLTGLTTSFKTIGDLDNDNVQDKIKIVNGTTEDSLEIFLSDQNIYFDVPLGTNLSVGTNLDIQDLPLTENTTGDIWGFLQANGTVTTANTFDGVNAQISQFPVLPQHKSCNFNNLIPERFFCIQVAQGNGNNILESGEMFNILFKLKPEHALHGDEQFGLKFIPKRGQETELSARTPDVMNDLKTILYPR